MHLRDRIWLYEGADKEGEVISGKIKAPTIVLAKLKLKQQNIVPYMVKLQPGFTYSGYFFTRLTGAKDSGKSLVLRASLAQAAVIHDLVADKQSAKGKTRGLSARKVASDKEVIIFLKQFLLVVRSGMTILKAFDIINRGIGNKKFKMVMEDIKNSVASGFGLSESFAKYPGTFDRLFINFLAISEMGGVLEISLLRYIEYKEHMAGITRKIKAALMYPLIILLVSIMVLGVVMGFVIPQFEKIFANVGAQLPGLTVFIINISNLIVNYWWLVVAGAGALIYLIRVMYLKQAKVHLILDGLWLKLPLFGNLLHQAIIARVAKTLAVLLGSGVALNEALHSIARLVDNYVYAIAVLNVKHDVESGVSLYTALLKTGVFPNLVTQMIASGEESGELESALLAIAAYYEEDAAALIETLLSLIEPVTIIVLGVLLGTIIISIYLPLFNLGNIIG